MRTYTVAEHVGPEYRDNPEVSHERSDVSTGGILRFALVLASAAVVIHVALYLLLLYYNATAPMALPFSSAQGKQEPSPEPRLRVAPRADLSEMRRAEDQALDSYGWVDRDKNIVRIPIAESIERLAEKGLPVRKQPAGEKNPPGPEAKRAK